LPPTPGGKGPTLKISFRVALCSRVVHGLLYLPARLGRCGGLRPAFSSFRDLPLILGTRGCSARLALATLLLLGVGIRSISMAIEVLLAGKAWGHHGQAPGHQQRTHQKPHRTRTNTEATLATDRDGANPAFGSSITGRQGPDSETAARASAWTRENLSRRGIYIGD
jgi:hypothetical protein